MDIPYEFSESSDAVREEESSAESPSDDEAACLSDTGTLEPGPGDADFGELEPGWNAMDIDISEAPSGEYIDNKVPESLQDGLTEVATEEVTAFARGTLEAFTQEGVRLAMHAMGIGLAYEVYYWSDKGVHAIKALTSDDGIELDLPVPVVDGLDLMVRVSTEESKPLVEGYIAPGDGSLAGAMDIGPADHHDNGARESAAEQPGETVPSRAETGAHPEARAADRPAKTNGQTTVAEVDLIALQGLTGAERVIMLQDLAKKKLGPQLIGCLKTRNPTLVIVYDPVLRLAWYVRIYPDLSRR
jgi:hypothetical protein